MGTICVGSGQLTLFKKNTAAVKIAKKMGVIFVPFFMANPRANQKWIKLLKRKKEELTNLLGGKKPLKPLSIKMF